MSNNSRARRGEADAFFRRLCDDMNRDVVHALLRSDTQCFSTEQYYEAKAAYLNRVFHIPGVDKRDLFTMNDARIQLERLPRTVREVKPDVWADAAAKANEERP